MKKIFLFALICAVAAITACNEDNPEEYTISVPVADNGTVTITVNGKAATTGAKAEEGATVALTAIPNTSYKFDGWTTTDITFNDPVAVTVTFTMPAKNVSIMAAFSLLETEYTLTVPVADNGTVAITVDGETVSTGAKAKVGATVVLTATPDAGYEFEGWTTTDVTLDDPTAETVTFKMPAKDVSITVAFFDPAMSDPGVEINGVTWATRNVDVPGKFVENPEDYGMFYQFNRRVGWSTTDPITSTDGSAWDKADYTDEEWLVDNDPCPEGWRVPSYAEQTTLTVASAVSTTWTTENEVKGMLFTDKTNENSIFLPAAGARNDAATGTLVGQTTNGNYWSNEKYTSGYGIALGFYSGGPRAAMNKNVYGLSIRCVRK